MYFNYFLTVILRLNCYISRLEYVLGIFGFLAHLKSSVRSAVVLIVLLFWNLKQYACHLWRPTGT